MIKMSYLQEKRGIDDGQTFDRCNRLFVANSGWQIRRRTFDRNS